MRTCAKSAQLQIAVKLPPQPEELTPAKLEEMKNTWARGSLAALLDGRVRAMEKVEKQTFAQIGLICMHFEMWDLWKDMHDEEGVIFHSFSSWMNSAKNGCARNRWAAFRAVKELREIPVKELEEMPRGNAVALSKVPKRSRTKNVIEKAKVLDGEAFDNFVERECPEAHSEGKRPLTLKFEHSQREIFEQALQVAMLRFEITSREEAAECLAQEALQSWEREDSAKAEAAGA